MNDVVTATLAQHPLAERKRGKKKLSQRDAVKGVSGDVTNAMDLGWGNIERDC